MPSCVSRMDVRGMGGEELAEGARRSTLDELAGRTLAAERVLVS
jgi:sulfur relay (sulfurtransferase) complex TusBCD TusD component (DsrE family)